MLRWERKGSQHPILQFSICPFISAHIYSVKYVHRHTQLSTRTHTHARWMTVTSQTPSCCSVVIYYPFCTQWSHEISLAFHTRTHTHAQPMTPFSNRRPSLLPDRDLFGLISTESLGRAREGRIGWMGKRCERSQTGGEVLVQEVEDTDAFHFFLASCQVRLSVTVNYWLRKDRCRTARRLSEKFNPALRFWFRYLAPLSWEAPVWSIFSWSEKWVSNQCRFSLVYLTKAGQHC